MKCIVIALAMLTLLWPPQGRAQMQAPPTLSARQFAGVTSGESIEMAVRVISRSRTTLHAQLLEQRSDRAYAATRTYADLYFPDNTPIVMGTNAGVTAGTVLFVSAVATKRNAADVKRATIVTDYVRVQ